MRKITYADDLATTIAKSVIRSDPVKAIVELVTNADDSFRRIGKLDQPGRITIAIQRGRDSTFLLVYDNAEGMPEERMEKAVGGYGYKTSGFVEGIDVRGLFGRGLKEAILGVE